MKKKMFALLLALAMMVCAFAEQAPYTLGAEVEDFSVTTWDGQTVTLSEVLSRKDMVLLHFFTTQDEESENEFHCLQAAREAYQDMAEVIAICVDDLGSASLGTWATALDCTFPLAADSEGLAQRFGAAQMPMSLVIDSAFTLMYERSAPFGSAEAVTEVFQAYTNAAYVPATKIERKPLAPQQEQTELTTWGSTPADIPAADASAVSAALSDAGLAFTTPEGAWPMIPAEQSGQSGVTSTNVLQDNSRSAIAATVNAKAGDAIAITFALSSEAAYDRFEIIINGALVKTFTGKVSAAWAWAVPADGANSIELAYVKDGADADGEDSLFISDLAVLTGDAAAAALAANPVYPAANATTLTAANARPIGFEDPTYALTSLFGLADYYIASGDVAFTATLTADADPGAAYIAYEDMGYALDALLAEGAYALTLHVPAAAPYAQVSLCPSFGCDLLAMRQVIVFPDEAAVQAFIEAQAQSGVTINGWWYAESSDAEQ